MENIALNDIKTLNGLLKIFLYVWKAFKKKTLKQNIKILNLNFMSLDTKSIFFKSFSKCMFFRNNFGLIKALLFFLPLFFGPQSEREIKLKQVFQFFVAFKRTKLIYTYKELEL